MPFISSTHIGKCSQEAFVVIIYEHGTRNSLICFLYQPISNAGDGFFRKTLMCPYILPRNIRNELLKAELLAF